MNADVLETAAKKARRMADIAKHKPIPLEQLDSYGQAESERTCYAQIDLMKLSCELQNAYSKQITSLWEIIKTLRSEALYWRQKFEEQSELKPIEEKP